MTPQEKTKEIIDKMSPNCELKLNAINCALIAVELILDEIFWEDESYFTEVKKELLKLKSQGT
jgi:hypothetical protein